MQGTPEWRPPSGVLGELVAAAQRAVRQRTADPGSVPVSREDDASGPRFLDALRDGRDVAVIAEVKRASPSRGVLAASIAAGAQTAAFARGGARAVSVLTEATRFGGSLDDLRSASSVGVPLLRKDFIVDESQLDDARRCGASAVLLIVRAVAPDRLRELHGAAIARGLATLVEVHTDAELHAALDGAYPVIGVNSRDLETLHVDPTVGERLIPRIPSDRIAVWESGIANREDVTRAAHCGADAVLVGSALSLSGDPESAVRALTGVERAGRRDG